jgi:hypothetical protein
MAPRRSYMGLAAMAVPALFLVGCIQEPPDPEAGTIVFRGSFPAGFEPKAFSDSRLNALSIDTYQTLDGWPTIRIDVPQASATPGYAGGPMMSPNAQDLSGSTALTFWTRASRAALVDKVGFGLNFAPYASDHLVTLFDFPVTDVWTRHVIPIPDPARLTAERGLFWYADSDPVNYSLWFGSIRYVKVDPTILDLQPAFGASALTLAVGKKAAAPLTLSYADLDGTRRWLDWTDPGAGPAPSYFSFTSSDWSVATVDGNGVVTGVAPGQARIGARLGQATLPHELVVEVVASTPTTPVAGPAVPTPAAGDVISLYGDSYTNRPITFSHTSWSVVATEGNVSLGGNNARKYTGLRFVGIDFTGAKIDASAMTHFHLDLWTPNATKFGVQLVAFPASGGTVARTVTFAPRKTYGGTIPPLAQGSWVSLDIPLALFAGLPLDTLGQILWLDNGAVSPGGDEAGTFFLDNVYFHK